MVENEEDVKAIDQRISFKKIRSVVESNLQCKIPVPIQLYNRLLKSFKSDSAYVKANFEILASSEDNDLWAQIAAIVQLSASKNNSSEFDNISRYDALIKQPLELILSIDPKTKINMTRNTCISSNLNEIVKMPTLNSSKQSSASRSSNKSSASNSSNSSTVSEIIKTSASVVVKKSIAAVQHSVQETSRKHLALRPDFAVFSNKFLMFVGEEKSSEIYADKAGLQLKNLLGDQSTYLPCSIFGNIPYLFGYTACRNEVKLFCFRRIHDFEELISYDLAKSIDCLKLFINMINIARIIAHFSSKLIKWPFASEQFFIGNHRNLGASVFSHLYGVVKVYEKGSDKFDEKKEKRVKDIYQYLIDYADEFDGYAIQCSEIVETVFEKASTLAIYLEPLCVPIEKCFFDDVKHLLKAFWCVLKVLITLHKDGYVHGDIRWPNIMHDVVENKYVLIDFDNGGKFPLKIHKNDDLLKGYPLDEMKRNGKNRRLTFYNVLSFV
jgi:hypothetical protein